MERSWKYYLSGVILTIGITLELLNFVDLTINKYEWLALTNLFGMILCAIGTTWKHIKRYQYLPPTGLGIFLFSVAWMFYSALWFNLVIEAVAFVICMIANHYRVKEIPFDTLPFLSLKF
jgi:hypothetical protein